MGEKKKVKIVACSGTGKVNGLIAREAVLKVLAEEGSSMAETMCLAHIVTGDADMESSIDGCPCITIDGCPKLCAAKSVGIMGGDIQKEFKVFAMMPEQEGVQLGTGTELTAAGWQIMDALADQLAENVTKIWLKKEVV